MPFNSRIPAARPVIGTCRAESDKTIALRVGADEGSADLLKVGGRTLTSAADGVRHVVEVAFAEDDTKLPTAFGVERHCHCFGMRRNNAEEQKHAVGY